MSPRRGLPLGLRSLPPVPSPEASPLSAITFRAAALALVLLAASSALALRAPEPAGPASALLAQGHAEAARLAGLPHGRAGVEASLDEALRLGGFPIPAPAAGVSQDLDAAILRYDAAFGIVPDAALIAAQSARLPADVRGALPALLDAMVDARAASRGILAPADLALLAGDPALAMKLVTLVGSSPTPSAPALQAAYAERAAMLARVDKLALAQAAVTLAHAVSGFDAVPRASNGAPCSERLFAIPTIEIGDACDDTYTDTLDLVIVDLGGDDTYLNNAGAGLSGIGAGVAIDLGDGSDLYQCAASAQGFGLAGVGILYDEGGSDSYNVTQFGQGASAAGAGILYDAGVGDDRYVTPHTDSNVDTKGASLAGVGVLVDEGGADYYQQDGLDGFVYGAGGGVGLLVDQGVGNDRYITADEHIVLDLAGILEDFGMMAGPIQVSAEAGGVAVLSDEGGDDVYQCGDHVRQGCQAAAGVGAASMLLDAGGNDLYTMGVSISPTLQDGFGVPSDIPVFPMGQGVGYGAAAPPGYGVALLLDQGGDDVYQAAQAAQGYGSVGTGLLVDEGGHDVYSLTAATFGARVDGGTWADGGAGGGMDLS